MVNAAIVIRLALGHKAPAGVHPLLVALRRQHPRRARILLAGQRQRPVQQRAAQAQPAPRRRHHHPANAGGQRVFHPWRQHAGVGQQGAVGGAGQHMPGVLIQVVDIAVHRILLDHKHLIAQAQHGVQAVHGKFRKSANAPAQVSSHGGPHGDCGGVRLQSRGNRPEPGLAGAVIVSSPPCEVLSS